MTYEMETDDQVRVVVLKGFDPKAYDRGVLHLNK